MVKNIFLVLFLILFTSCGIFNLGKKTESEKERTTITTEKTDLKKDSTNLKKVNIFESQKETKSIDKSSSISLKTADSIANKRINEALRNFKVTDRSGQNTFSAKYDENTMRLIFDAYIEGTKSVNKETNTDQLINTSTEITTGKTFEDKVSEKSKKVIKMIPLWLWVVVGVWFFPQILSRLQMVFNPLYKFFKK